MTAAIVRAERRRTTRSSAASSSSGATSVSPRMLGGHARARGGHASGGQPAAGLHEHRVGVPVVAAFELQDARAAGGRPGDAQRRHDGLGARGDETNPLDPRQPLGDPLGQRAANTARTRRTTSRRQRPRARHGRRPGPRGPESADRSSGRSRCTRGQSTSMRRAPRPRGEEDRRPADAAERAHGAVHAAGRHAQAAVEELCRGREGGGAGRHA